ncbi:MAG: flagellar export chaperone FliS [Syntrophomonadaceae bacterium]|nr:flagellar export chaperone FliS [Syntrophomonadaceae bacterium]
MNIYAQAYNQYKRAEVETVSPEKLLLLLFKAAIKDLSNAQKAIQEKDMNLAHNEFIKVQDILVELMSSLKMEYEVSNSLYALYDYMQQRVIEANMQKDIDIAVEIEGFFRELYETFQQAERIAREQRTPVKEIKNQIPSAELAGKVAARPSVNVQG